MTLHSVTLNPVMLMTRLIGYGVFVVAVISIVGYWKADSLGGLDKKIIAQKRDRA